MFSNLQIRPAKAHRRKPSLASRSGVSKRRVSTVTAASASNVPSMSFMEGLFGDEFPEAFVTGGGTALANKKSILDLPTELLAIVCDHLSKLDIKRLRLVGRQFGKRVNLRTDRVVISPNRANLANLEWILDQPRYRSQVREIVWDDAQLEEYPRLDAFRRAIDIDERQFTRDLESYLEEATSGYHDDSAEYRALGHADFFEDDGHLTEFAKGVLLQRNDEFSRVCLSWNVTMMTIKESYAVYQRLYQEEQDLIRRHVDIVALRRTLASCPNIKRVTLTSECWRPWSFGQRYDTPFHRALPLGFRKPSVWPWLGVRPHATPSQEEHREDTLIMKHHPYLSSEWRGYSIIVSALLTNPRLNIEEFIIDAGNERTGINHRLFASVNNDLKRTIAMFSSMPLKRLNLALNADTIDSSLQWLYVSSHLRVSLRLLQDLQHLDLSIYNSYQDDLLPNGHLPNGLLSRLITFTYRNSFVRLLDLIERLTIVKHITLYDVRLADIYPYQPFRRYDWAETFRRARDYYAANPQVSRPSFTWMMPYEVLDGRNVRCGLLEEQIDAFLYQGGECPFDGNKMKSSVGWLVDARDENFKVRAAEVYGQAGEEGWAQGM